jgi:hypothetical protein
MQRRIKLEEVGNWFDSDGFEKIAETIYEVTADGDGAKVTKLIKAIVAAGKHLEKMA